MTGRAGAPLWVRIVGAVGGAALLGVILFTAWLAYSLNGGWPLPHTDPHDPRVEDAHDRWAPAWDERHATMLAELEADGLVVLSVNEADTCHEGETNWKRRDAYGLQCTLEWVAVLGAPAGDPTATVTAVHETVDAFRDRATDPDDEDTLVDNLQSFAKGSALIASASYDGVMTVDGEQQITRLEAFVTREAREYVSDEPILTRGDVVRSTSGPTVPELEDLQLEWVGSTSLPEARWLVRLTDRVSYFAR